ncbi:TPA: hypothetical protein QCH88_004463 [Enterobacter asburiae]|nr:hypothetical protein [Enterobacter asburiae]
MEEENLIFWAVVDDEGELACIRTEFGAVRAIFNTEEDAQNALRGAANSIAGWTVEQVTIESVS